MLENGLLTQGSLNQQLTWMDAKVNGKPVTPRSGIALDIQALWYNSLMIMSEYAKLVSNDSDVMYFLSNAELCKSSFRNKFFIKNSVQLADYIDGDFIDQSFRPNQLFAFSLPYSLLSTKESRLLLFEIRSRLLTNRGLRTLDSRDPEYKGVFIGGPEFRDKAYHQGTVWPWLLAYYAKGVMAYAQNDFRSELEYLIDDFSSHLEEGCLGTVSEVFDGDSPHLLGGTASQAWSVGAIRYCRELLK
jgi:predicted glycogen debranching enzyme